MLEKKSDTSDTKLDDSKIKTPCKIKIRSEIKDLRKHKIPATYFNIDSINLSQSIVSSPPFSNSKFGGIRDWIRTDIS